MKYTPLYLLGGIVVLALIIGGSLWSTYNGLVSKSQAADAQWANVQTELQRRFDLIPNLVASVQGIFNQEQSVFNDLAQARTHYAGATTPDQQAQAGSQLDSALSRLLVVVENYPQLTSQQNVTQLMDEIAGTENRIAVERQRYNDDVQTYNNAVQQFPGNTLAGMFGFHARAYFEPTSTNVNTPPPVSFSTPVPAFATPVPTKVGG